MISIKEKILGIDIGGSKINMVLWNGKKVLKTWRAQPANLANLRKGVEIFSRSFSGPQGSAKISGALGSANFKIGIAVRGVVDEKTSTVLRCPNLHVFNGLNLKRELRKNVRIGNVAKCFLKAEVKVGVAKGYANVLGIIFGTGIGGAFTNEKLKMKNEKINKEVIYMGRDGWAGEFGHMIIGKGKSWEKLYQATENKPKEQERINTIGFANLINVFNPEIIILGGKGAKPLSVQGVKLLASRLLLPKKQMPKFVFSKLKDNAVAIGAAMLWK